MGIASQFRTSTYGLPTRVRSLHREAQAGRSLLRWYPSRHLLDPYSVLDLTTPWEQAWVTRWFARNRPEGAVVELGTWLGAITRAIARGGHRHAEVYDTFTFTDVEARTAGTPLEGRHRDGDSFLELYLRRCATSPSVHAGDILQASWTDGPIGFLFVDLAKTWEIWNHVRAEFLAQLRVGSVVVQQDWAHAFTPWLHLWHHRWRHHFQTVEHVVYSGSVAFRLVAPLPPAAIRPDRLEDYPLDEVNAAFAWAAGCVRPSMRPNIAGAHVIVHAYHGRLDDAVDALLRGALEVPVVEEFAGFAIPELARRTAAATSYRSTDTDDVRPSREDPGTG